LILDKTGRQVDGIRAIHPPPYRDATGESAVFEINNGLLSARKTEPRHSDLINHGRVDGDKDTRPPAAYRNCRWEFRRCLLMATTDFYPATGTIGKDDQI
jgi:hypothetical protein